MTEAEIAYVAGIVEGEGCLAVNKRSPSIRVVMTDRDVIFRLQEIYAGNVWGPSHPPAYLPHYKPRWAWNVFRSHGLKQLLLRIRPWMGIRRLEKLEMILTTIEENPSSWAKIRRIEQCAQGS